MSVRCILAITALGVCYTIYPRNGAFWLEHEFELGTLALNLALVFVLVFFKWIFRGGGVCAGQVRHSRLTELQSEGESTGRLCAQVNSKLDAYLSATQFGITLASLGLGWVGEPAISELLVEPLMYKLGFSDGTLITTISVIIGFAVITFFAYCTWGASAEITGDSADRWRIPCIICATLILLSCVLPIYLVTECRSECSTARGWH